MSPILVMIALGLLVIFSLVVAYFSAKTWPVAQVVLVTFVFLTGVVLVILASATLKTHQVWRERYNRLERDLEVELAKTDQFMHGDPSSADPSANTLPGLRGALERELVDRGRVWRNVRPQGAQQGQITVDMSGFGDAPCIGVAVEDGDLAPQPDPEAQQAARPHGITEGMILYAFQETSLGDLGQGPGGEERLKTLFGDSELPTRDTQGLCRLPTHYLGEFQVTAVADNVVRLAATLPLDQEQIQQIQAGGGTTWTLSEIMPIDRHDIFEGVTQEQMRAILPQERTGLDDQDYSALIEEYARDNREAREGDVEERTWVGVKFLKPHEVQVDAEIDDPTQVALTDRSYDSSGLAVSPILRQQNQDPDAGPTVTFDPGDTALFDAATAETLVQQQICEVDETRRIYRRPLRDYEYFYRQMSLRFQDLDDQMAIVRRQTQAVADSAAETRQQIQYRDQEKGRLQADLKGWQDERSRLQELWGALNEQAKQQRQMLSRLYRENVALAAQRLRQQDPTVDSPTRNAD